MTKISEKSFVFNALPDPELAHVYGQLRREAETLDRAKLVERYRAAGLDVEADPFSQAIGAEISAALRAKKPFSVVRIGDGEVSFLTYGRDPATPQLDRFAMERSIMNFPDRFRVSDATMLQVQAEMQNAIAAADIVGVVGLWRGREIEPPEILKNLLASFRNDVRGRSGHWRAIRHLVQMAEEGALAGKQIRSAHLYFGVIKQLPQIMDATSQVLCLTNQRQAVERMQTLYPNHDIKTLELNATFRPFAELPDNPIFLDETRARLPEDLTGQLVLIGAGAWAEFYCTWVKERGGVAVDIGSGFDLLAGQTTRPVHGQYFKNNNLTLSGFLGEA